MKPGAYRQNRRSSAPSRTRVPTRKVGGDNEPGAPRSVKDIPTVRVDGSIDRLIEQETLREATRRRR